MRSCSRLWRDGAERSFISIEKYAHLVSDAARRTIYTCVFLYLSSFTALPIHYPAAFHVGFGVIQMLLWQRDKWRARWRDTVFFNIAHWIESKDGNRWGASERLCARVVADGDVFSSSLLSDSPHRERAASGVERFAWPTHALSIAWMKRKTDRTDHANYLVRLSFSGWVRSFSLVWRSE